MKSLPTDIAKIPRADAHPRRKIFLRDLRLDAFIGAYESEQGVSQPVIINIEAEVIEPANPLSDRLDDVVCYNKIAHGVRCVISEGHIKLVETLAERIADLVLSHPMALSAWVKVEKPNAISDAASAGVEILRRKP